MYYKRNPFSIFRYYKFIMKFLSVQSLSEKCLQQCLNNLNVKRDDFTEDLIINYNVR